MIKEDFVYRVPNSSPVIIRSLSANARHCFGENDKHILIAIFGVRRARPLDVYIGSVLTRCFRVPTLNGHLLEQAGDFVRAKHEKAFLDSKN